MPINEKLKELRKTSGLSQEQVAEELDISRSRYARLESGESKLDYETLQQIAMLFKIDIAQLVEADAKGLVLQQTVTFQENHNDNKQNQINIYTDKTILLELEATKAKLEFSEKLLAEKDNRIQELNAQIETLNTLVNVLRQEKN